MKKNIIYLLSLLLITVGCVKEELEPATGSEDFVWAEIALELGSEPTQNYKAVTKSNSTPPNDAEQSTSVEIYTEVSNGMQYEPSTKSEATSVVIEDVIKNVWFFQIAKIDEVYVVACEPTYISDYQSLEKSDRYVRVANMPTGDFRFIYVANSFAPNLCKVNGIKKGSPLADLLNMSKKMEDDMSCFGKDGTKYYPLASGDMLQTNFSPDTPKLEPCTLYRNFAKVTVTIEDISDEETNLNFYSGVIQKAQDNINYFAALTDAHPQVTETAIYHYENQVFHIDLDDGGSTRKEFVFYVPVNKQGTTTNTIPEEKPTGAPKGATYFKLVCGYDSKADPDAKYPSVGLKQILDYKFYLGANNTDDFNIKANTTYTSHLSFKNFDKEDPRVKESTLVQMPAASPSNCYMINPDPDVANGIGCIYALPFKERIKEFWTDYADPSMTDTEIDAILENEDRWDIRVLWYDCKNDPFGHSSLIKDQISIYTNNIVDDCFEIGIDSSFDNWGNMVVGIVDTNGTGDILSDDKILWSWHLWLTEYDPYFTESGDKPTVVNAASAHSVDVKGGGKLHHYKDKTGGDALWGEGGKYADKLIMDRNIGAMDASRDGHGGKYDTNGRGRLYFQFGRKDPFPGNDGKFLQADGSLKYQPTIEQGGTKTFVNAVENPTVIYCGKFLKIENWTNEVDGKKKNILWNDKNALLESGKKSIFDPSPWNFQLVLESTWDRFGETNKFQYNGGGNGYKYVDDGLVAEYFYTFFRSYENGLQRRTSVSQTIMWSANTSNENGDCGDRFNMINSSTPFTKKSTSPKATGAAVRCIQQNIP